MTTTNAGLKVESPPDGCWRVRPIYKGVTLGVIIGMVYCLSMQDVESFFGMPSYLLNFSGAVKRDLNSTSAYWVSYDGPPLSSEEQEVKWIMAEWEASAVLNYSRDPEEAYLQEARRNSGHVNVPKPPHLENCEAREEEYRKLDSRSGDGRRPVWSLWRGLPESVGHGASVELDESESVLGEKEGLTAGPFPPWIEGADEHNLPFTRRVQRDLWLLQHPRNCSEEGVRFLFALWAPSAHLGLGAQLVYTAGLLAVAVKEQRVLVLRELDRADHQGCQGPNFRSWSCYFLPETTDECRRRAYELKKDPAALADGRILMDVRKSHDVWLQQPPALWGKPWEDLQPTTEIDGKLLVNYKRKDMRWWRAQAVRYLMRFPSRYTCMLLNKARHDAFGLRAATRVLRSATLTGNRSLVREADMEKLVWQDAKPWIPRPLLSVHVRVGDKAREMKLVDFHGYMDLATRLRNRFPDVQNIWLSSEMQDVIDSTKLYPGWNFYHTHIPRQTGNTTMGDYERSLGTERATTNSVVNFLMASDADFFVGALGSTWCFLIDGMRSTAGKQMAGYLSVNRDRYWRR